VSDILKVTINLTVICALAGIILSATWAMTEPVKVAKEAAEREQALKALIPGTDNIKPVKDVVIAGKEGVIYEASSDGNVVGYIVADTAKGYSSFIKMLVAVSPDYNVMGIDILGHGETPGLGDQVEAGWFKEQFKGKGMDNLVVVKGETKTDIQAISGATISSRAVTKGVKDAVDALKVYREQAPAPGGADGGK